MLFIADNFLFSSLQDKEATIKTKQLSAPEVQQLMNKSDWRNAFYCDATKTAVSAELGFRFEKDVDVFLKPGDRVVLASFSEFDTLKDQALSVVMTDFPGENKSSFLLIEVSL